jgi:hypothetical protein
MPMKGVLRNTNSAEAFKVYTRSTVTVVEALLIPLPTGSVHQGVCIW